MSIYTNFNNAVYWNNPDSNFNFSNSPCNNNPLRQLYNNPMPLAVNNSSVGINAVGYNTLLGYNNIGLIGLSAPFMFYNNLLY